AKLVSFFDVSFNALLHCFAVYVFSKAAHICADFLSDIFQELLAALKATLILVNLIVEFERFLFVLKTDSFVILRSWHSLWVERQWQVLIDETDFAFVLVHQFHNSVETTCTERTLEVRVFYQCDWSV